LIFVLSLYFQRQRDYSAIETGLAFVPATVGVMAGNLLARRAASKLGPRAVLGTGALLMAVALAALLVIGAGSPYTALACKPKTISTSKT
jgi:DHA2 family methylenomycin A resistance protein-like MFS transporter